MTTNISLRPINKRDINTLYKIMHPKKEGIPEWKKWDAPYFPYKRPSYWSFKQQILQGMVEDMRYLILLNEEIIGMVTFYWEHRDSRWLEVGIVIYNPEYWSGGIGSKAMYLWIDHLFNNLPLVRCGYTTWSGNKRMMRVGEKLGMKLEACIRKSRYYKGEYYDSVKFGILREEWEDKKDIIKDGIFNS